MKHLKELPLGIYEKALSNRLSWENKLELARESGFDCIEMSIDGSPERLERLYQARTASIVNAASAYTGVPIYTMALTANRLYPLGCEDNAIRGKGLELVERAVGLAEETGIKIVHIAGYDELGDKCSARTEKLFRDSLERIMRLSESSPVTIAIETMDAELMGSCHAIVDLCREIGADRLRCYADVGNLSSRGLDVPQELEYAGAQIVGIHFKDAYPGICRDVAFGDGIVDFSAALRAMEKIAYQGYMTAEAWSYDNEQFHPYLKKISAFLREKLEEF